MNIYEKTAQLIPQLEQRENIEILYMCESGSRAWGFPSPNSDYDLRFIYKKPRNWYLELGHQQDTLDWFAEDNLLDFSGWDVRKTLDLFVKCNLQLNEQLASPVVYYSKPEFTSRMQELIPAYFRPIKGMYHYFSCARNAKEALNGANEIKVKALFYIVRPLCCCAWIDNNASMPPTAFVPSLDLPIFSQSEFSGFKEFMLELIEKKKSVEEAGLIPFTGEIRLWTELLFNRMKLKTDHAAERFAGFNKPGFQPVNELLLKTIL